MSDVPAQYVRMARISPRLTPREAQALLSAARADRRDPRDLAAIFIVQKLEGLGYLEPATKEPRDAA